MRAFAGGIAPTLVVLFSIFSVACPAFGDAATGFKVSGVKDPEGYSQSWDSHLPTTPARKS
jgi:hypothetical protein